MKCLILFSLLSLLCAMPNILHSAGSEGVDAGIIQTSMTQIDESRFSQTMNFAQVTVHIPFTVQGTNIDEDGEIVAELGPDNSRPVRIFSNDHRYLELPFDAFVQCDCGSEDVIDLTPAFNLPALFAKADQNSQPLCLTINVSEEETMQFIYDENGFHKIEEEEEPA